MAKHNLRKRKFAKYYVIYEVGKTAAIKAGYKAHSAATMASILLDQDEVQGYIKEYQEEQREQFKVESKEVIKSFFHLATYDINDYFDTLYRIKSNINVDGKNLYTQKDLDLLFKYKGYNLTEVEYENLPEKFKMYYEKVKELKDFNDLTKAQRVPIEGVTYDRWGNTILKLSKKKDSLESLAKHFGLYVQEDGKKDLSIPSKLEISFV